MNIYYIVDFQNKTIYDLGKVSSAAYLLPYFASKYKGKRIMLYGDESQPWIDFETIEYGGEYIEGDFKDLDIDWDILKRTRMSDDKFYDIAENIGGKIIMNLEDFIEDINNYSFFKKI